MTKLPHLGVSDRLMILMAVVICQLWTTVSGKVLATQMSARVVQTQYGKLRGVHVTLAANNVKSSIYRSISFRIESFVQTLPSVD